MEQSRIIYYDPLLERFKETHRRRHKTIDYRCLRKYDLHNKHFSLAIVTINEKEKERLIGYNCVYRYGTHEVKLEYRIAIQMWTIVSDIYHSKEEEKQFKKFIDRTNMFPWVETGYTLDEPIQYIIRLFNRYFIKLNQAEEAKKNNEKMSKCSSVYKKENGLNCADSELIEASASATIIEGDEQQPQADPNSSNKNLVVHGLHLSTIDFRQKFSNLVSSPTAVPVRRRRVIESIILRVQRKKKTFAKFFDVLKGKEPPTTSELGLEFLRIYDGIFNYREGHKFVMSFRKKTWFLTIEQFKCIDCPLGDIGPRSVLTLSYKGHYTSVHV